jgi:hypothetical protein
MSKQNKYILERVDLGFWTLPKPPDYMKPYRKQWERVPNLNPFGTIPYGYEIDPEDSDWLLPVEKQLTNLELAKKHIRRYSYNEVAAWLTTQTGRSITGKGLKKRIEVDRRRKRLIDLKRFYAKRYEKIIKQIEILEITRLGKAKADESEGGGDTRTCSCTCGCHSSGIRGGASTEHSVSAESGASD